MVPRTRTRTKTRGTVEESARGCCRGALDGSYGDVEKGCAFVVRFGGCGIPALLDPAATAASMHKAAAAAAAAAVAVVGRGSAPPPRRASSSASSGEREACLPRASTTSLASADGCPEATSRPSPADPQASRAGVSKRRRFAEPSRR